MLNPCKLNASKGLDKKYLFLEIKGYDFDLLKDLIIVISNW